MEAQGGISKRKTKRVLVPLAPGFEEMEAVAIIDILRRAGAEVVVAGTVPGPITASRGVKVLPDTTLDEALKKEYDLVALPGGAMGSEALKKDLRILRLVKDQAEKKRALGAICAAPKVLEAAGLLQGRRATSHPSVMEELKSALLVKSRVVQDRNLVTSQGPGTAIEFAFKLVEILYGADMVEALNKAILARVE